MTLLAETQRMLGVLIDGLASGSIDGEGLDWGACQSLLMKAGLMTERPATQDDVDQGEYDFLEVGDPMEVLTEFAVACRKLATDKRCDQR